MKKWMRYVTVPVDPFNKLGNSYYSKKIPLYCFPRHISAKSTCVQCSARISCCMLHRTKGKVINIGTENLHGKGFPCFPTGGLFCAFRIMRFRFLLLLLLPLLTVFIWFFSNLTLKKKDVRPCGWLIGFVCATIAYFLLMLVLGKRK